MGNRPVGTCPDMVGKMMYIDIQIVFVCVCVGGGGGGDM